MELQNAWTVKLTPSVGWSRIGPLREALRLDEGGRRWDQVLLGHGHLRIREVRVARVSNSPAVGRNLSGSGEVKNVARVRLNGKDLGGLWTRPFRVEITGAVKSADNRLEIEVANLWPNRLIGDAALPPEKRFTRTHVSKFTKDTPLIPSGLLGPVTLRIVLEPRIE